MEGASRITISVDKNVPQLHSLCAFDRALAERLLSGHRCIGGRNTDIIITHHNLPPCAGFTAPAPPPQQAGLGLPSW